MEDTRHITITVLAYYRKYPYPCKGGMKILTPLSLPLPLEIPKCSSPPCPPNYKIVNPSDPPLWNYQFFQTLWKSCLTDHIDVPSPTTCHIENFVHWVTAELTVLQPTYQSGIIHLEMRDWCKFSLDQKETFPASRGLSQWGKMKREERDLCWLPTSFLSRMCSRFLNNQWRFCHVRHNPENRFEFEQERERLLNLSAC